jgi:hypothetical protein
MYIDVIKTIRRFYIIGDKQKRKIEAAEMRFVRSLAGITFQFQPTNKYIDRSKRSSFYT